MALYKGTEIEITNWIENQPPVAGHAPAAQDAHNAELLKIGKVPPSSIFATFDCNSPLQTGEEIVVNFKKYTITESFGNSYKALPTG